MKIGVDEIMSKFSHPKYYDRKGNIIDHQTFCDLLENSDYRIVKHDEVVDKFLFMGLCPFQIRNT